MLILKAGALPVPASRHIQVVFASFRSASGLRRSSNRCALLRVVFVGWVGPRRLSFRPVLVISCVLTLLTASAEGASAAELRLPPSLVLKAGAVHIARQAP